MNKDNKAKWQIYIPEEGNWDIQKATKNDNYHQAKEKYLRWANRKTLPKGSLIIFA